MLFLTLLICLFDNILDRTAVEESALGQIIMLAVDDLGETADCFRYGDVYALEAVEILGNMEGLGEEILYLPCTLYKQLILVRKLIHTHDCDNIHQLIIPLQNALYASCNAVMLFADYLGAEDTACGFERIDGRVDAL